MTEQELQAKINDLRELTQQLFKLVNELTDADPCQLDHHGYCQAHGWMSEEECPHRRAKRIIGEEKIR